MQIESLTLLEKASLPDGAPRLILQAMELEINSRWGNLATGSSVENLQSATTSSIENLQSATTLSIENLRLATASSVDNLRLATASSVESLRLSTDSSVESLRLSTDSSIEHLRSEMANLRMEMLLEIRKAKDEVLRWVFGLFLTQTAMLLGLVYFLHGRH